MAPDGNKTEERRSEKTGRLYPKPKRAAMDADSSIKFLFTKMTMDQVLHLWDAFTLLFIKQCLWIVVYALVLLRFLPYWYATVIFGVPFAYLAIQNIYILHDVAHGASFPPYLGQRYICYPFADIFSIPLEDFIMEHNKHHS